MSDRIDFGDEPWQAIPRRVLRDSRLSARAKGGLVTLLSHDEGWVRSAIAVLQNECSVGRKQAQAIMAELRELGYATLVHEREGNLVKTRYLIQATPKSAGSDGVSSADLTDREPSRPDSGPAPQRSAVVDPPDVDPQDEEPTALELAPTETVGQRANRITTVFVEARPMSNFPAISGIVRRALDAGFDDQTTTDALLRLAAEGRTVTVESLRIELEGLPPIRGRRGVAALDQIAEQLREAERA